MDGKVRGWKSKRIEKFGKKMEDGLILYPFGRIEKWKKSAIFNLLKMGGKIGEN